MIPLAMFVPTRPLNGHARMPVVVPGRTAMDHGKTFFVKKKRQWRIFFSVAVHCVALVALVARVARVARAVVRLAQ